MKQASYKHTSSTSDYTQYLAELAATLGQTLSLGVLEIPEVIGKGFSRAFNLNNGLSALICDCYCAADYHLHREKTDGLYFILQFDDLKQGGADEEKYVSQVLFYKAGSDNKIMRKKGDHIRSLKIMISSTWLNHLFDNDKWSQVLLNRLSLLPGNTYCQPMTAEIKVLLNKVIQQTTCDPLMQLYIENRILLLIEKFLFRLDRIMRETGGIPQLEADDLGRLKEVEEELKQKVNGPAPTISQLARIAAMSPTKLKKIFKEVYGVPVYRYYQKVRMNYAKDLLTGGAISVKEAGLQVGYSNLSHFATAFRKEFDLLPSEMGEVFSKN
jgi:AraC-like DNA-binding protein